MISITDKIYVGTAAPEGGGGGGGSAVIEELNVTPTTSAQVITAGEGVDGYSPVNVSAVTSSIDANIVASNIVDGIAILGVTGSATELNGTTLNVTPTTSAQTITPTSPNNGFTEVDVDAVTSSIDANIQAGNIKNGVNILGVTGNVNALVGQTKSVSQNGVVTPDAGYNGLTSVSVNVPSKLVKANYWIDTNGTVANIYKYSNIINANTTTLDSSSYMLAVLSSDNPIVKVDLSAITTISSNGSLSTFAQQAPNLIELDLSSLTELSIASALANLCQQCATIEKINLSSLATVSGQQSCSYLAYLCTSLQELDLSSLTTISGQQGCEYLVSESGITSINLPSLTTVSGSNGLGNFCIGCTSLVTAYFPMLSNLSGSNALFWGFYRCTSLTDVYFNALTTTSFGSYTNQFINMLGSTGSNVTHTLHFPSNMESTIQGLTGYPLFGGTSGYVVLAFDLTATS